MLSDPRIFPTQQFSKQHTNFFQFQETRQSPRASSHRRPRLWSPVPRRPPPRRLRPRAFTGRPPTRSTTYYRAPYPASWPTTCVTITTTTSTRCTTRITTPVTSSITPRPSTTTTITWAVDTKPADTCRSLPPVAKAFTPPATKLQGELFVNKFIYCFTNFIYMSV